MGTFTWKSGFCLGRCSRNSGNFVSNATSSPLQVLGTRLVQADSYPTWFENVAVVVVMVVGARRPSGLPASETFSCRPARALSPAGRGRCHLHHTRMERGGRSSLTQEDRLIGTDFVYSL